jgi:hypothetical protein
MLPRRYSRAGLITANFFLINGILALSLGYKTVFLAGVPLYLSTLSYWYDMRDAVTLKYVDMFMAGSNIAYITYLSKNVFYEGNPWIRNILIGIAAYIVNSYIYYYQVLKIPESFTEKKNVQALLENRLVPSMYNYFSLEFTEPFTFKRHCAYWCSVLVHVFFLHALPCLTCMYCLIETERRKNICLENGKLIV